MGSKSDSIVNFVQDANSTVFLPAIQRDFVWSKEQIIKLFDSVFRGYPIGSLLLWRTEVNSDSHVLYRLLSDAATAHPAPEGSYSRPPLVPSELVKEREGDQVNLVLDGQQRLTALLIGLTGSLREKKRQSWTGKQRLYIDLLSGVDDARYDGNTRYNFQFSTSKPDQDVGEFWYRVGRMLESSDRDDLDNHIKHLDEQLLEFLNENEVSTEEYMDYRKTLQDNLSKFHRELNDDGRVQYFEENTGSHSRVLDIFIRINDAGTELDQEEILLSILTDKWARDDVLNAKEEINGFLTSIKKEYEQEGIELQLKTVIRAIGLFVGLGRNFEMYEFTDEHIQMSKEHWERDKIQKAFRRTLDVLVDFGFVGNRQVSSNVMLPLAYYFFKNPQADTSQSKRGKENRRYIHYWVCSSELNKKIKQRPNVVDKVVEVTEAATVGMQDGQFPLKQLSEISNSGYSLKLNENDIKQHFEIQDARESTPAFAILSLIYYPEVAIQNDMEIDHIVPRSKLSRDRLESNHGLAPGRAARLENNRDALANLQLLPREDNRRKSNKDFSDWVQTMDDDYHEKHLVPTDGDIDGELASVTSFDRFLSSREANVLDYIIEETDDITTELTY